MGSLLNYGRLERQHTLYDFDKTLDVDYRDILGEFDLVCCIKGLFVTRSNLEVTWKLAPNGHHFLIFP